MSLKADPAVHETSIVQRLPPLENGDRLSREEFERRYEAMPHLKKAELIEGVVYVPSPVSHHLHGRPHAEIIAWLDGYELETPGSEVSSNPTVRLDMRSEPQPDVILRIDPGKGGQSGTSADDFIEGPPELIAEVAASSASYDLHAKLHIYRRSGVKEYIVWRTWDGAIDWFVLRGGAYRRLEPDRAGILKSRTFPGLWLDPAALLRGNRKKVLATLRRGLRSPAHKAFARRLKAAARRV